MSKKLQTCQTTIGIWTYRFCNKIPQMYTFFLIEVQLIYNVVLVSGVQQSDSAIYIFFFRFFSLIDYYKILSIFPCATQQVLVGYLFYVQQCVCVNPKLLIYPAPLPTFSPLVTISLFSMYVGLFLFLYISCYLSSFLYIP